MESADSSPRERGMPLRAATARFSSVHQNVSQVTHQSGKHVVKEFRNSVTELREAAYEDHKRRAFFYPHHYLMGTTEGQFIFLMFMAFFLIGTGMAAWIAIGGNVDADTSLEQSFWISWGLFFDPGTQTGVPADDRWEVKLTAMSFSILGFIFNLAFLGLIVDLVRTTLGRWKHKFARIVARDHILILGWSDKTLFLLTEVVEMVAGHSGKQGPIWLRCFAFCRPGKQVVVLAERDALQMQEEVKMHFHFSKPKKEHNPTLVDKLQFWKSADGGYTLKDIKFREGDPASRTELMKVSAHHADALLISSCGGSLRQADEKTVQTLLAIAALPTPTEGKVVAEMQSEEGLHVVSQIIPQGVSAMGIFARLTVNRMMLLRGLVPTVGYTYMELGSFSHGNEVYVKRVPQELAGKTMKEVGVMFTKGILLAVMAPPTKPSEHEEKKTKDSELKKTKSAKEAQKEELEKKLGLEVSVDPDRQIQEKDMLVMFARNLQDSRFYQKHVEKTWAKVPDRVKFQEVETDKGQLVLGQQCRKAMTVALVGCPPDFTNFLSMMDDYLAPGSHVYLLSERDLNWRVEAQKRQFGVAFKDWRHDFDDEGHQQKENDHARDGVDENTYKHLVVHHVIGSTTSNVDLRGLPHEELECILVLSDSAADEEPSTSDSRMLISVLTITTIRNQLKEQGTKLKGRCKMCTELLDPKSKHVVDNNPKVGKGVGSVVYSASNETGLFAMAAHDPTVYHLAMGLMDPRSGLGHIVSVPAREVVEGVEKLSYYDLKARVRQACGGILMGWHRVEDRHPSLNPPKKEEQYEWSQDDRESEKKKKKQDELIIFMTTYSRVARASQASDAGLLPGVPEVGSTMLQEFGDSPEASTPHPVLPGNPELGEEEGGLQPPN